VLIVLVPPFLFRHRPANAGGVRVVWAAGGQSRLDLGLMGPPLGGGLNLGPEAAILGQAVSLKADPSPSSHGPTDGLAEHRQASGLGGVVNVRLLDNLATGDGQGIAVGADVALGYELDLDPEFVSSVSCLPSHCLFHFSVVLTYNII
jgi:hypothetical protein